MLGWRVMAVGCALAVSAGCSTSAAPDPLPPPTSTTAPSPLDEAERSALDAYRGMWEAFGIASRSADWDSPELARFADGYALQQLVESLQADDERGVVTNGSFTTDPVVETTTPADFPTVVRLLDCGDDTGTSRVRESDGQVLDGGERGRHRIQAEVRLDGGEWLVVDFRLQGAGTC